MNSSSDFTLIPQEKWSGAPIIARATEDQSVTVRWERLFYNSATKQWHDLELVVAQLDDTEKLKSVEIQKIQKTFNNIFYEMRAQQPDQSSLTPDRMTLITDAEKTDIQVGGTSTTQDSKRVHDIAVELYRSFGFMSPSTTTTSMPISDIGSSSSPSPVVGPPVTSPVVRVTSESAPAPQIRFTGYRISSDLMTYLDDMPQKQGAFTQFLKRRKTVLSKLLKPRAPYSRCEKGLSEHKESIRQWFKHLKDYWAAHEVYIKHQNEPGVSSLEAFACHWLPELLNSNRYDDLSPKIEALVKRLCCPDPQCV